mmetsp:Transcript_3890/g.4314  ORF Transcript_3890/g.4314 Transcript_3890/m.4314 type:complete len:115 (+) Transcript_3890:65-409(+)|eukprot:CAMPEP_0170782812 /NCGR_PEP_ID=MMETSP0733-20121128/15127_1 /TAXON_ID=186038 /ORGANISM="Fragilariopsis kerguelensis, Strain L26-C5" /LENGTH=114 /DNA_ID=CAMNT_0011127333 /DNA_START=80 /DNA_END=424 /DNA_ORIENTATION=+
MKTFQLITFFALFAASMAFAPNHAPQITKAAFLKGAAAVPVAALAAPAFAMDTSIVEALPSIDLSLQVQFGAYLAILLGVSLPVLFLVNLYVQTESRKEGAAEGEDDRNSFYEN